MESSEAGQHAKGSVMTFLFGTGSRIVIRLSSTTTSEEQECRSHRDKFRGTWRRSTERHQERSTTITSPTTSKQKPTILRATCERLFVIAWKNYLAQPGERDYDRPHVEVNSRSDIRALYQSSLCRILGYDRLIDGCTHGFSLSAPCE